MSELKWVGWGVGVVGGRADLAEERAELPRPLRRACRALLSARSRANEPGYRLPQRCRLHSRPMEDGIDWIRLISIKSD
jgi:hypothetical protein